MAFNQLQQALQTTATPDIPDPMWPFTQKVDEKEGRMTSVLLQDHESKLCPVANFSAKLNLVAALLPIRLRAVAEKTVNSSRDIVGHLNIVCKNPDFIGFAVVTHNETLIIIFL